MMQNNQKKYLVYLNVVSAFAVVMLHVNHKFWEFSYDKFWIVANIIESVFYFAVPVFFMISGVNLIGYSRRYSTQEYAIKRIDKVVIPFIAWSILGRLYIVLKDNLWRTNGLQVVLDNLIYVIMLVLIVWGYIYLSRCRTNASTTHSLITKILKVALYAQLGIVILLLSDAHSGVGHILHSILNTSYISIYWFFIPLFLIYVSIPILERIDLPSRDQFFKWAIIATFIINFLLKFVLSLFNKEGYIANFQLPIINSYLWFVLVGYYLHKYPLKPVYRKWLYLAGILGLLMHLGGTHYLSYRDGELNQFLKGYLNVPSILYALALFVLFQNLPLQFFKGKLWQICQWFATETFGVYLIHWFIIDGLEHVLSINPYSSFYRIFGGIAIFILSTLLVKALKRIPYMRYILP